jgi:hypothetical protein
VLAVLGIQLLLAPVVTAAALLLVRLLQLAVVVAVGLSRQILLRVEPVVPVVAAAILLEVQETLERLIQPKVTTVLLIQLLLSMEEVEAALHKLAV